MRTADRVLSAVFGLALFVGGLVIAVEIAVGFVGGDPWILPSREWYRDARSNAWNSGGVRGILIVVAALGLVLLVLQLVRRLPTMLPLESVSDVGYAVRRRSLQRSLVRTANLVDGVERAKVRVGKKTIRVRASSHRRIAGELQPSVESALRARVDDLGLESTPRLKVDLRTRGGNS